jgi:predicted lipid-binding transport protein (Tim44 family)
MTTRKRKASTRLRSAQVEIVAARAALDDAAAPWRVFARNHRAALSVGGGFIGGLIAGALPRPVWRTLRAGFAIVATAFAKSLLMPALAGTLFAKQYAPPEPAAQPATGEGD